MTPKEKAIELVDVYKDINTTWIFKDLQTTNVINYDLAKQCALIAVDEIIDLLQIKNYSQADQYEYWNEVKHEIEKL